MITWIVNIGGLILIGVIVWWFWFAKQKAKRVSASEPIDIVVENGVYTPAVIKAKQGETLQLRFLRKDASPCSQVVLFDHFGISSELPLNQPHMLTVELKDKGEYEFTCQMGMYRGTLIVE